MLLILLVGILLVFCFAGFSGAPWIPTRKKDLPSILDDAKLAKGQLLVELGSGDGRLLVAAAKRDAKVIGYEINPLLWLVSKLKLMGYTNAHVKLASLWKADLSGADVVVTFLVPRTMPKLATKLNKQLKPGATFISYAFDLPGKKPVLQRRAWRLYKF